MKKQTLFFIGALLFGFCSFGSLDIVWKGITQTVLSESDFQLRYKVMLQVAEKIPLIGYYMPALFPKAHHEYKAYRKYESNGKKKFGLLRFFLHHTKSAFVSPLSFSINGANHLLFSFCRFFVDYSGARLQEIHNRNHTFSMLQDILITQCFLLSGINLRTEILSSALLNRFYLFEHFCGMLLQHGLIMFFVTKYLAPMLKKIPFYKTFDRFLKNRLQKPTISALNRYIFDPIMEKVTISRRKIFSS